MFSPTVLAQTTNGERKYVVVNDKIRSEVIEKTVKSYDPDKKDEIFYKKMLTDAFDAYFAHKKLKANVYEQDTINSLNRQLSERISEVKRLSKDGVEQRIHDIISTWSKKCDSIQKVASDQNDTIVFLREQLAYAQNTLQTMRQSTSVLENIMEQLKERQMAINTSFASCTNSQLVNIQNIPDIQKSISSYMDFLGLLKQPVPSEQMTQIEIINVTCSAALFCQAVKSELSKKYNVQAVNELMTKAGVVDKEIGKLKPMQQTEFSQLVHVLKNEELVVLNLKNGVLASLAEEGCIPDEDAINNALEIISNYVSLITNGDPNCNGGYNTHYVYLNNIIEKLRSDIKQSKKKGFDNETKYKNYIDSLRDSLSEQ